MGGGAACRGDSRGVENQSQAGGTASRRLPCLLVSDVALPTCSANRTAAGLNILLVNVPLAWTAAFMKLNPLLIFGRKLRQLRSQALAHLSFSVVPSYHTS